MAAGNSDSREVIDLTVELESLEERKARRSANRLAASQSSAQKNVVIDLTSEEAVERAVQPVFKPRRSGKAWDPPGPEHPTGPEQPTAASSSSSRFALR